MARQVLLEIFTKGYYLDGAILILLNGLSWLVMLILGLRILKAEAKLITIIPAALLGALISFIKPLLPGAIIFFLTIIPLVFLLKFYGKTKWIIACWVTFILIFTTTIGPLLITSRLPGSLDFLITTRYGAMIGILAETFVPAILLALLSAFNFSLIPSPGKILTRVDFIDIYILGALFYWWYESSWEFLEGMGSLKSILVKLIIKWLISSGAVVGFYIRKVTQQKRLENLQREHEKTQAELQGKIQEMDELYRRLKEEKLDPQEFAKLSKQLLELHEAMTNPQSLQTDATPDFEPYMFKVKFTPREQDVIRCIAKGFDNAKIASELILTENYIVNVVTGIKAKISDKMGMPIADRMLVVYAINWSNIN